jgi:hypothetical protein
MDTKYLLRIAFGALVVFVAGLATFQLARGGRRVADYGRQVVDSIRYGSGSVAVRIPFVPIYVDGDRVGTLDSVVLLRHDRDSIEGIRVVVQPGDGSARERLAACTIELTSLEHFDLKHALHCAGDTTGLAPFGMLVADREGHPLFVREDRLAAMGLSRTRIEGLSIDIDSLTRQLDSLAQHIEEQVRRDVEQAVKVRETRRRR